MTLSDHAAGLRSAAGARSMASRNRVGCERCDYGKRPGGWARRSRARRACPRPASTYVIDTDDYAPAVSNTHPFVTHSLVVFAITGGFRSGRQLREFVRLGQGFHYFGRIARWAPHVTLPQSETTP